MGGLWFYTDRATGARLPEQFTAEQASLDQSVVRAFEGIEAAHARGETPDAQSTRMVFEATKVLPPKRAEHHVAEMARVGIQPPQPPKKEEKKDDNKRAEVAPAKSTK